MSNHKKITNTSKDGELAARHRDFGYGLTPASIHAPGSIEAEEAAGQRELLQAGLNEWAKLPTSMRGVSKHELEDLGFKLGKPVQGDPMFTNVRLPDGWFIDGTSHSMHTSLYDAQGFKRAGIFYKAAYYDRSADLNWLRVPVTVKQEEAGRAIQETLEDEWGYPFTEPVEDGSRAVQFVFTQAVEYKRTGHQLRVTVEPDGSERSRETSFDAKKVGEWR